MILEKLDSLLDKLILACDEIKGVNTPSLCTTQDEIICVTINSYSLITYFDSKPLISYCL